MRGVRLFVAIEIPAVVRQNLRELIARLRPKCKTAKWVRPESMHLTLKFIGHVADEQLRPIREVLSAVHIAGQVEAQFRRVGFFPNEKRARVVWAGAHVSANLAELAAEIDRGLAAVGIPSETKPYSPHITLARLHTPLGLAEIAREAQAAANQNFGSLVTTQFQLFESKLKPSGAEYTSLETFQFAKA